jgi:aromatic-L-amino-acid decarboxylase
MDPALLRTQMQADVESGLTPMFICATIGTTGNGACDDLVAVAEAAAASVDTGLLPWIHVDAAHLGSACICPEFRPLLAGIERADSFAFNPHKWMLTNFDCDCFFTQDRGSLTGSMSITPEYLRNTASDSGVVFDYRDWHVPLGRRFRALKLWLVIQYYGVEGLREYIRAHVRMGEEFAGWVRADPRFEVVATSPGLVCIAVKDGNEGTKSLVQRINAGGRMYVTGTLLPGSMDVPARYVLRMAIGAGLTRPEHVERAWQEIQGGVG